MKTEIIVSNRDSGGCHLQIQLFREGTGWNR